MENMLITDIEEYFKKGCGRCDRFDTPQCSTLKWNTGLQELRHICTDVGLSETVKWGHPCYLYGRRNIVIIGAHLRDFRLCFFNSALMKDPDNVLEKQGPNTQFKDMLRFTDYAQIAEKESIIRSYLKEAIGYAEAGTMPPKIKTAVELPEELVEALDSDPMLAEAFHALTPGRQRSYVINLTSTNNAETRIARIERFRPKIIAGKGAMDR